jgi:hypothetical protein
MTTVQADVRAPLATALAGVTASVYESVPEAVIAPACFIIPGTPYMETRLISSAIQLKLNFTISAVVAYNNNAGALDNLEKLAIEILAAIPSGYEVGDVSRPSIITLGSSNFLIAEIDVATYYTQQN